ncbi:MAG: sulfatase [Synoicihabitans sp.]
MKRFLLYLLLFPLGLVVAKAAQPNIILFLVDDMGLMDTSVPMLADRAGNAKAEPLNAWYRTPNMERLAKKGIRFSQFYAHTVCSPTRVSIMTGQNSARHHTTQFISPRGKNTGEHGPEGWNWAGLTADDITLPGLLREAGYRTIHVGKAHFAPPDHIGEDPSNLGFEVNVGGAAMGQPGSYWGQDGYGNLNPKRQMWAVPGMEKYYGSDTFLTEALTIEAKAEIDRSLDDDLPFYLYMSHYAVHSPFQSDPRFEDNYSESEKDARSRAYATLIEGMDKSLGDLMDHLETRGIAENTLIIFMGDNGSDGPFGGADNIASSAPFRGKKASRWEGGIRVPFIAAWGDPQSGNPVQQILPIKAGAIQSQVGICYDVFPTILNVANAEFPSGHVVDGQNLQPLLTGERDPNRKDVFLSHFPHEHRNSYFTSYRAGNWKLIYHYLPESGEDADRYELYNLRKDPSESENQAKAEPERLARMTRVMTRQLDAMNAQFPVVDGVEQRPIKPSF